MTNVPSLPAAAFLQREARSSTADQRREAPVGETMDLIFIEGFEGETVIGINSDELNRPQPVRIDLVAGVPRSHACDTDRIGDTIDYGAVHEALTRLLASHKVQLLEALAEAITKLLIDTFGAHWVRVVVVKPRKFANVSAVGVAIERRRPARMHDSAMGDDDSSVSYLWRTGPTG
jgi:7,8-dihydroneopterin aldolase/epimerase/oxygenase